MDSYYEKELDRLHGELATIYKRGRLTPQEKIATDGLWARIERLNTTMVRIQAREGK
jgi:hypothetical protein